VVNFSDSDLKTKMKNQNKNTGRVTICLLVFTLSLCLVSAGGFGSSFVPKVNGQMQLEVPIGTDVSYYIYPQNSEDKVLLVKIEIIDENNIMTKELEEQYEIPALTSSDDYKIELVFSLEDNPDLIGQEFPIEYSILSTYKEGESSGIVTFNPVGFTKKMTIKGVGKDAVVSARPKPPARTEEIDLLVAEIEGENIVADEIIEEEEEPEGEGSNTLPILLGVGVLVIVGTSIVVKKYGDV